MKTLKRTLSVLLCLSMLLSVTLTGESVFSEWIRESSFRAFAATTETFYVAFDTRGGNDMAFQSGSGWITLTSEKPLKRNYIFLGWSTEENSTTVDRKPGDLVYLNDDIVLYAIWLYNENPAQGDVNGDGSITIVDYIQIQKYVNGDNNLSASEISRADFNKDGTVNAADYYAVMQAITNENRYVLTYNSNGGDSVPQSQSGSGSVTITRTVPTKRGFSFDGWSTNRSATEAQYQSGGSFSLNQDRILYAVWVENEKPIGSIQSTNNVAASQTVTLSLSDNDAVAGYYWGTSSSYSNNAFTATSARSVTKTVSSAGTYYLTVKDRVGNLSDLVSVTFYKTTLNANGGTITPASVLTASGKSFTLPMPTHSDAVFRNWNTDSSGGGSAYSGVYTPTRNATLYAVWSQTGQMVQYNFSANGGTSATKTSAVVKEGVAIDLTPTAVKSGWDFIGWNTNANATTKLSSLNMGSADVTLYAIYKKTLTGTFIDYSGTSKNTVTRTVDIYNNATSGTLTAPTQNTYTGWTKRGWSKDTASNASVTSNYTISSNTTYYGLYQRTLTLSYNANGGASTPASQTGTQYTNSYSISSYKNPSFTLADAISKSGATFNGWAKGSASGTVYSARNTISISENTTMFAVWNPLLTLTKNDQFSFSNDHYTFNGCCDGVFINGVCYCGHCSYKMKDADFKKLSNYVRAYYGSNKDDANSLINELQEFRNESWGGSCYGMAATVLLDKYNKIGFNENFDSSSKNMYNVKSPYQNSKVQSAINYYMISQSIGFTRTGNYYHNKFSSWSAGLKQLVSKARNGDLMLFCYYFDRGGHAIVIKGYEQASDGGYNLIAYDNRYPNRDVVVKVDKDYRTCVVDGDESAFGIEFLSDFSSFDLIDIDGPNNDMVIQTSTSSHSSSLTELNVVVNGEVTITNSEGKTLVVSSDGAVSGTMEIVSTHLIVKDNEDGTPAPATLSFEVNDSKSFTVESTAAALRVSVQNDSLYASAETTNADAVVIGEHEGIYMIGDNIEYSANLSLNNDLADMVELEGKSFHNVNVLYNQDGIELNGTQAGRNTLTVYSNDTDVDAYNFDSSYSDVLITNNVNGEINVLASSKSNGTYDVTLIGAKQPSITMNNYTSFRLEDYRSTLTFSVTLDNDPLGSEVHWFVNETDEGTGKTFTVTEAKNDFTVQAKLISQDGKVLAETEKETVKIKTGFFAKLKAFFRALFGRLPKVVQEYLGVEIIEKMLP